MTDRLSRILEKYNLAVNNLNDVVETAHSDLEIDGVIKRFELCFELAWKLIKEYLANLGIVCKNPRDCFKHAFNNDMIDDDNIWLKMIDDRNELVHQYDFANSREIVMHIKNEYIISYRFLLEFVMKDTKNE